MTNLDEWPSFAPSTRVMLGDEIYAVLQQAILASTIAPDVRINAGELARRFDVSPTPIREALARLESDGLVEKSALKGYRTTDLLNRQELIELFELRELLEPGTAAHAAERRSSVDVADLEREIEFAQAAVGESDSYAVLAQHDVRLHDAIFRSAGNETVRRAYERTHCHLHTFRLAYRGSYVAETVQEHADIVSAIAQGDPVAAENAMRRHLSHARERILPVFHTEREGLMP